MSRHVLRTAIAKGGAAGSPKRARTRDSDLAQAAGHAQRKNRMAGRIRAGGGAATADPGTGWRAGAVEVRHETGYAVARLWRSGGVLVDW